VEHCWKSGVATVICWYWQLSDTRTHTDSHFNGHFQGHPDLALNAIERGFEAEVYMGGMTFLSPNQQCQSTKGLLRDSLMQYCMMKLNVILGRGLYCLSAFCFSLLCLCWDVQLCTVNLWLFGVKLHNNNNNNGQEKQSWRVLTN